MRIDQISGSLLTILLELQLPWLHSRQFLFWILLIEETLGFEHAKTACHWLPPLTAITNHSLYLLRDLDKAWAFLALRFGADHHQIRLKNALHIVHIFIKKYVDFIVILVNFFLFLLIPIPQGLLPFLHKAIKVVVPIDFLIFINYTWAARRTLRVLLTVILYISKSGVLSDCIGFTLRRQRLLRTIGCHTSEWPLSITEIP